MTAGTRLPRIDASSLADSATLAAIDRACREWGVFEVVGHGIPADTLSRLRDEMRAFFSLPLEAKLVSTRTVENPWGFYDRELTKNIRDCKEIFDCGPEDEPGRPVPWPERTPGLRDAVMEYRARCKALAIDLVGALAACLDVPPALLTNALAPSHASFLRLNYYPTGMAGRQGVNHHTDAGILTVLTQDDVPGLEVLRDGQWHLVPASTETLVVNIGDVVQVWSNDRYAAPVHRVRRSEARVRTSAPYFLNPSYSASYAPLPGTEGRPRYCEISWKEFRARRAEGDYADVGPEVQISDYRIDSRDA